MRIAQKCVSALRSLTVTALIGIVSGGHFLLFTQTYFRHYCFKANVNSELPAETAMYCLPPTT